MKSVQIQQAFDRSMVEIRTKFIDRIGVQIEELDMMMERLEADPLDKEALYVEINLTHKIAGVAPTLRLDLIGKLAREAELKFGAFSRHADRNNLALACDAVERLISEMDQLYIGSRV